MRSRRLILSFMAGLVLAATSCGDSSMPTAPTVVAPVSPSLQAMLTRAITDEYRAETTYQRVIEDFGQMLPFVNVLTAETRHSAAIGRLFAVRGLTVPVNAWTVHMVPHFPSAAAACAAGVVAERENIALYDELLRDELPWDVRQVFTNNRRASLLNHLPAFERCQ